MKIPKGLKRAATLCVLKNSNRFLLLRRFKEPNKNKYTPVGGKIDPFENPLDSAIRETNEETGIKLDTMKFCGMLTETSPIEYNWICYVYLAEIGFIPAPNCKEGKLEWVDFENVLNIPTPKTDWFIYKYILDNKPFAFSAEYDENLMLLSMQEDIENKSIFKYER